MKAIMVMFDSLNRNLLPAYGCDWTKLPNFKRLEEKAVVFDNFYAGSLPCMPARRELHTGRYHFLHRSWGPMEPFDESCITNMRRDGVFTHLSSDHLHYWEDGGGGYHTKYNTWDALRGQEGDAWIGQVKEPVMPESLSTRPGMPKDSEKYRKWRQDWVNRGFVTSESEMPQTKTFQSGLDFIDRNAKEDRWFLQIESFDPHEPFFTLEEAKETYPHSYGGKQMDWPDYGENWLTDEVTEHLRFEYASLLSLCDKNLGKVLDKMDEYDLWKDTMLIVNTDHGFMLGEKNWMGKNFHPLYNEIARIPCFIYDPRSLGTGHRSALCQTIDLGPTLLGFFGAKPLKHAQGKDLAGVIAFDSPVRQGALFGMFGKGVNVTDGRYVYLHGYCRPDNSPLYEYTLMPTHMNCYFSTEELRRTELFSGFSFTQGCPVLKIESGRQGGHERRDNLLFDLETDAYQEKKIHDLEIQKRMAELMRRLMEDSDCPGEQYVRIGIPESGPLTSELLEALNRKGEEIG